MYSDLIAKIYYPQHHSIIKLNYLVSFTQIYKYVLKAKLQTQHFISLKSSILFTDAVNS